MSIATSRQSSRSFVDLTLLSCVLNTEGDIDLEPDEMKDLRSFTGVRSAYRIMAVSPDGQHVLFKLVG
ncbi:unnamed protein product [Enterobius vermicularis]|uniref:TDP43_N domain-containing protein n=1 Tax=Enterobius vermicularis TaxID=51028 RepID=A0A0N4VJR4_ENTVE|nr:unnamed protein product [Enterobius vermicularis]